MRAMGAPRTRAITAALMLAIGVAACAADEDTGAPAEGPTEAPKEAAEETPWFDAGSSAELTKESPDGPGSPAAEPEEDEEEAPEADRE